MGVSIDVSLRVTPTMSVFVPRGINLRYGDEDLCN